MMLPVQGRRALFLDRDGVINVDSGYVARIDDMHFMPGIFELVTWARSAGMAIVVVTNQSGIGRGYFSEADYSALTRWMLARFAAAHAPIDRVYHCPFHPNAPVPQFRMAHPWRKPEPGMLIQAAEDLGIHLPSSVMIGDKMSDMEAAKAARIGLGILVGDPEADSAAGEFAIAASPGDAIAILQEWLQ